MVEDRTLTVTLQLSELEEAAVREGLYRLLGNRVCVDVDHETVLTTDEAVRRAAVDLYDRLVKYNPATGNEELDEAPLASPPTRARRAKARASEHDRIRP